MSQRRNPFEYDAANNLSDDMIVDRFLTVNFFEITDRSLKESSYCAKVFVIKSHSFTKAGSSPRS